MSNSASVGVTWQCVSCGRARVVAGEPCPRCAAIMYVPCKACMHPQALPGEPCPRCGKQVPDSYRYKSTMYIKGIWRTLLVTAAAAFLLPLFTGVKWTFWASLGIGGFLMIWIVLGLLSVQTEHDNHMRTGIYDGQ